MDCVAPHSALTAKSDYVYSCTPLTVLDTALVGSLLLRVESGCGYVSMVMMWCLWL